MPYILKYRPLQNLADVRLITCRVPKVNKFIQGDLEEALRESQCDTFGVYDNNKLVAFFALRKDEKFVNAHGEKSAMEIAFLVVSKAYELQGVGTAIIKEISRMVLEDYHCKQITVEALVITHPPRQKYEAVTFYKKCKFLQAELYDRHKETLALYRDAIGYEQLKGGVTLEREI